MGGISILSEYTKTEKADGERLLMFMQRDGGGKRREVEKGRGGWGEKERLCVLVLC
jgi:hypothetical protein